MNNPRMSFKFPIEVEELIESAVNIVNDAKTGEQNKWYRTTTTDIVNYCVRVTIAGVVEGESYLKETGSLKISKKSEAGLNKLRGALGRLPKRSKGNGEPLSVPFDPLIYKCVKSVAKDFHLTSTTIVICCVQDSILLATRVLLFESERRAFFDDKQALQKFGRYIEHLNPEGVSYGKRLGRASK